MNQLSAQLKLGGQKLILIVINGQGGCGKDSFVKLFQKYYPNSFSTSIVDGVKEVARQIGWEGEKDLKDRKFLSDLKDVSEKYNDFPYRYTKETIENLKNIFDRKNSRLVVFVHAREPRDIKRLIDDYDAKTLLIRRPAVEGEYGNHADDMVFTMGYDYTIWNDSTMKELEDKAKFFLENVLDKGDN